MPITATGFTNTHAANRGGNQNDAKVVALANGEYVVGWTDTNGAVPSIQAQRFSATGQAIGTPATIVLGPQMALMDMVVDFSGRVVVAGAASGSAAVTIAHLDATTLTPVVANTSFTAAQAVSNVSIAANASNLLSIYIDTFVTNTITQYARINSNGTVNIALNTIQTINTVQVTTREVVATTALGEMALQSNGNLLNFVGITRVVGAGAQDFIEVQPGMFVVGQTSTLSNLMSLRGVFGANVPTSSLVVGDLVTAARAGSSITSGVEGFASEIVHLGNGRILMLWVADQGDSFSANALDDGLFAAVYDINTGGQIGDIALIRSFGRSGVTSTFGTALTDAQMAAVRISATVLGDGRVAVALTHVSGITGNDVFTAIVDARGENLQINATAGSDFLLGSAGNDTFNGVGGGDTVEGGAGVDTVIFTSAGARVVDLAYENSPLDGSVKLVGVENLTGGSLGDRFLGSSLANVLFGGNGNDTIDGRGGNDTIGGDAGNDSLGGGSGNDQVQGGSGNDYMSGGTGNDLMLGEDGDDVIISGAGDDHIDGGIGLDRLYGQSGDDSIFGDDGDDVISGGAGDDYISGDGGNDRIDATEGVDTIFGGLGNDLILIDTTTGEVDGGAGIDTVSIFLRNEGSESAPVIGFYLDLNNDTERLFNSNAVTLLPTLFNGVENATGSGFGDAIYGNSDANVLRGQGGDDTIQGRGGADILFGGNGADVFVFANATSGADVIRDYAVGQDKIRLHADAFGDIFEAGIASRLTINATATVAATASAQLIFDNSGAGAGRLFFDADGNGAGAAVLFATLTLPTADLALFSAADFVFV